MLPRQLKEIEFSAGLMTKGDTQAEPEQMLDIATNVEFDDVGGLRCRFPFDNVRTNIVGGGTLANARRLAMLGNELVCFTSTALYSWIPALSAWAYRSDHLAIAVTETDHFPSSGSTVDTDRAELSGIVVHAWTNYTAGNNKTVYVGAFDKASNAILLAPTLVNDTTSLAPRLTALATKIVLTYVNVTGAGSISAIAIDPANLAAFATATPTVVLASASLGAGDISRVPGADQAVVAWPLTATTYGIATITSALAISSTTKTRTGVGVYLAVAAHPDALHVQIVRADGANNLKGDYITISGFVDVNVNQAISTGNAASLTHLTAAYRAVQNSGHYRCYVFWDPGSSSPSTGGAIWSNWIDDGNSHGADAALLPNAKLTICSHAFAYASSVFFIASFLETSVFTGSNTTGFRAQLQNTYFIYRDDGTYHGKAADDVAATPPDGSLPSVINTSGATFAFLVGRKTKISIGTNQTSYAAPWTTREVVLTFDSNSARRTAQLGNTLYIAAGGEILQYDGQGLYELGFDIYPWTFAVTDNGAGLMGAGGYTYKMIWRWSNAAGEVERSTTATTATVTIAASHQTQIASFGPLAITRKTSTPVPDAEVWRTQANPPPPGAPFFLVSSTNQGYTTNPGRWLPSNVSNLFQDNFADATIAGNMNDPLQGQLDNLAPPGGSIIAASDMRLFLAGIPGTPNTVWYSKQRNAGEIAAFNDALTFTTPTDAGPITAIGVLENALIVWCATATYQFAGVGFDNTGGGQNYQLARIISKDLGCVVAEACALFHDGFLVKTSKGWFLLDRSLNYTYVGAAVVKYDAETVLAMSVLTGRHQVRVLTTGRILVFDTLVKMWAETSVSDGVDMLVWNGVPSYLTATGVRSEMSTLDASWTGYTGTDYTLTAIDVETNWVKFAGFQGRAIVDFVQLLGELRSPCAIQKRIAKDYETTAPNAPNYHTNITTSPIPGTVGGALQVRQAPRWKRCESLKARFTITALDGVSPLAGPCVRLTAIAIPHALEPGAYDALSAGQKK